MEYAPIALFVYNRPNHTKKTLETLSKNALASQSTLYIFADGPKNSDPVLAEAIRDTRQVIRSQQWCKDVVIVEFEFNRGLAASIISGVTEVVNKHGKVIVLEDDIETSSTFLDYMNVALDYYAENNAIAGVSGFSYKKTIETDAVFFLPIGCSWGWGSWKRVWDTMIEDSELLLTEIQSKRLGERFNFGEYPFLEMLTKQKNNIIDSWAIRFYASFFLRDQCFVYPPVSLVRNHGFDRAATNTKGDDDFFSSIVASELVPKMRDPEYDLVTESVRQSFRLHQKKFRGGTSLKSRFLKTLKRLKKKYLNKYL